MDNRIKTLRKNKNITQDILAKEIGVTKLTISRWERGERIPKSDKAQKLANYFGVSVGYLLGYEQASTMKERLIEDNGKPLPTTTLESLTNLSNYSLKQNDYFKNLASSYSLKKELQNIGELYNLLQSKFFELQGVSRYYTKEIDDETQKELDMLYKIGEDFKENDPFMIDTIKQNLSNKIDN